MWWRRKRNEQTGPCPEATRRIEEAKAAREATEERLAEVQDRWPEVREVASSLRHLRERNHFAELVARALGGRIDPDPR